MVDTVPGRTSVFVACDPAKISPQELLAALENAGESAQLAH
jgi:allophanate hydrolase subunit 1